MTRSLRQKYLKTLGVESVSLDELVTRADYLHLALPTH